MPDTHGARPEVVVLDIEGTTTPIAFVHQVLFPFARARLPALLRERGHETEVAAELAAVEREAPGADPLSTLLGWMDRDAKTTPLKALQGMVWRDGYAEGALKGSMYPDVAPCLARWRAAGLRLFVYSSGSVEAQRLIFGHSDAGDLRPLFAGFFDTNIGPKRDAASYRAIARKAEVAPERALFLSDVEAELAAAAEAGFGACQIVRPGDGTVRSTRFPASPTLDAAGARFGLP